VFTPTLTGVAERSHLLSTAVNLDTHIDDVSNLIRWEELSEVVLCGHSYGGCVISGVADRIPDRIGALVYLDAFVLEDGESLHQTLPPTARNAQLEGTLRDGEAWKVPPIPAQAFHVNAKDAGWVDRQCTMQPLATFQQALKLTGGIGADVVCDFVGFPQVIPEGIDMLRAGGTYVEIGTISRGARVELEPSLLVWGSKKIVGIIQYDPWAIPRALDFLVRNRARFPFDRLLSHTYPLEKINEAFAASEWHAKDSTSITRAALVP